jgi:small subunit ribosomal protein S17
MSTQNTQTTQRKALKGIKAGIVVSDKCDKSRKVEVAYLAKLPKYGKYLKRRTYFHVHDPQNDSHQGDLVEIVACRPISKNKSWRLVRVVETAAQRLETVSES